MNRIALMVLKNTLRLPGLWSKLCAHAKNPDNYPEIDRWMHIQKIMKLAIQAGNVTLEVTGQENIPEEDGILLVSNHQGMFDIFIMYGYVQKRFKWIMKDTLRKMPLLGKACYDTGHIFVNRETPQKDLLRKSINILKSGASMGIFPEGTRCRNGKMGKFKKGAFVIANMTQTPVLPITIDGAYDILPKGCKCVHWSPVTLTFHAPIECQGRDSENVDYMMDATRAAIAKTLGESHTPTKNEENSDNGI